MDPKQQQFESLSPEEQEKLFHESSFRDKGDLLMRSHEPRQLARSLSEEELYLVTKELDREERSEILKYASLGQLFFVSDVDCWKKDRIDAVGFLSWLQSLREASEKSLLTWLVEMDYETVITGLKKLIYVTKPEWEYATDEVLGDKPQFTLDNYYYIYVNEENYETIRRAIELLYENHRGKYTSYMEAILAEMGDELEEDAFQRREARLAERGFPYPEHAKGIYKPITKKELKELSNKREVLKISPAAAGAKIVPNYPVLWTKDRLFLDDVLLSFKEDSQMLESLHEELAWLSNKVIACEGIDFSSEDRVKRGVMRARAFVNIGLEILSGGEVEKAVEVMRDKWLELVFRVCATRIRSLRDSAFKITHDYWNGEKDDFVNFLREPYESLVKGVLLPVPECYDPAQASAVTPLRDFQSIHEIERTELSLKQLASIHALLREQYKYKFDVNLLEEEDDTNIILLLGTLVANFVVTGKASLSPVSQKDIITFLSKGFDQKLKRRVLAASVKEAFLNYLYQGADKDLMATLWGIVFDSIDDDFGHLPAKQSVAPEFVSTVLIQNMQAQKK